MAKEPLFMAIRDSDPEFRQTVLDVYVPIYGENWETEFLESVSPTYARIDADRMFTFHMPPS